MWDNPFVDSLAGGPSCFFIDYGSNVHDNVFVGNGSFGNPTNGDLADLSDFSAIGIPPPRPEGNCWHGNVDPAGVTSAPPNLQPTNGDCATAAGAPASVTRCSARCCATSTSSARRPAVRWSGLPATGRVVPADATPDPADHAAPVRRPAPHHPLVRAGPQQVGVASGVGGRRSADLLGPSLSQPARGRPASSFIDQRAEGADDGGSPGGMLLDGLIIDALK